jgi:hypothetical protein
MIGNSPQGILLILSGGVGELGSWGVGKNNIAWMHGCMDACDHSVMQTSNHAIMQPCNHAVIYQSPISPSIVSEAN